MNSRAVNMVGGMLVALLASVAIWQLALFVLGTIKADQAVSRTVFGLIISFFSIVLVKTLSRRNKKRPHLALYSLVKKFLGGMAWYAIPAMFGLIVFSLIGIVEVSVTNSFMDVIRAIFLVAALVFLSEALPEEIIFRGYVFGKLSIFRNRWLTVFLQAAIFVCFAFMIGALSNLMDASFIFTFGIALGILRTATGSIVAPMGFHLACMTAQQSFSSQWSPFTTLDGSIVQTFILGIVPISIVIAYHAAKVPKAQKQAVATSLSEARKKGGKVLKKK